MSNEKGKEGDVPVVELVDQPTHATKNTMNSTTRQLTDVSHVDHKVSYR